MVYDVGGGRSDEGLLEVGMVERCVVEGMMHVWR